MGSSFQRGTITALANRAFPITSLLSFLTAELYDLSLQHYSAVRVTAANISASFSFFQPYISPLPSEPSKGHPCTHSQLLCDRKLPAYSDVWWQLSGSINGRKILAVTWQRGGSSSKGDGNHGKIAQCVLHKGLSYIQVNRKHNACR